MPLDEAARKTIEALEARVAPLQERIAPLLAEVDRWKTAINAIYEACDEPPPHVVGSTSGRPVTTERSVQYGRGDFHGRPLAAVVRQIITDHGPQSLDELYATMVAGGFVFEKPSEKAAKIGLTVSLGKSRAFAKLDNGYYNLATPGPRGRRTNGDETEPEEVEPESSAASTGAPSAAKEDPPS